MAAIASNIIFMFYLMFCKSVMQSNTASSHKTLSFSCSLPYK